MQSHEVPTHLDFENRPLFGLLSLRQAAILGLGAGAVIWLQAAAPEATPGVLRLVLAAVPAAAAGVWALVRPLGRPLEQWAAVAVRYALAPRRYRWTPGDHPALWRPRPAPARMRVVMPLAGGAPDPAAFLPWRAADLPAWSPAAGRTAPARPREGPAPAPAAAPAEAAPPPPAAAMAAPDEDALLIEAVVRLVARGPWQGTASDLIHVIRPAMEDLGADPEVLENPATLGRRVRELAGRLARSGVRVDVDRQRDRRLIILEPSR